MADPDYTLTNNNLNGGFANVPSDNFKIQLLGHIIFISPVTITPSDGGAGGTFTPTTIVYMESNLVPSFFTYTPPSIGSFIISVTNDGILVNPPPLVYNADPPNLAVIPAILPKNTPTLMNFIGGGTRWVSLGAPTFTLSGAVGTSIGPVTVLTNNQANAIVIPANTKGVAIFTDSTTGASTRARPAGWQFTETG